MWPSPGSPLARGHLETPAGVGAYPPWEIAFARGLLAATVCGLALASMRALFGGRPEHSDEPLHLAALLRMSDALARGENPIDHWFAGTAFGYPLFRVYPPLGHLLALSLTEIARTTPATALASIRWLALCTLPLSVWRGLRWAGFPPLAAAWGGALALAPASLSGYGLELAAFVPRGHGLFAQLVAMHACALSLGALLRAARETGDRRTGELTATLCLAAALLAHPTLALFTVLAAGCGVVALGKPLAPRLLACLRAGFGAFALTAWYLLPAFADRAFVLHSRWEPGWKWDSVGFPAAIFELFSGKLVDCDRLPILTVLAAAGAAIAILRAGYARSWLAVCAAAFALYCGPAALHLHSGALHFHRAIAILQLGLVGLAGLGATSLTQAIALANSRRATLLATALAIAILAPLALERSHLLRAEPVSAEEQRDLTDFESVIARINEMLREHPGRVYAGAANGWGESFLIAGVPACSLLTSAGVDTVGCLYHALGIAADAAPEFDDADPREYLALGISILVLPVEKIPPPFVTLEKRLGRFAVYRNPGAGLFRAAEAQQAVHASPGELYVMSQALRRAASGLAGGTPGQDPPGRVESSTAAGNRYSAQVVFERPGLLVLAMTAHPGWRATVDGQTVATAIVLPGFVAAPVGAGRHSVGFDYEPGAAKTALLGFALLAAGLLALLARRRARTNQAPVTSR